MPDWTRVSSAEEAARLLPAWFAARMAEGAGAFGLLLATGDVLRATALEAAHLAPDGTVLLDLMLDGAGVPEGADLAWRQKHFLGMPLAAGTAGPARATVNLAQVVAVVEFGSAARAAAPPEAAVEAVEELKRAAEDAATGAATLTAPDTRQAG